MLIHRKGKFILDVAAAAKGKDKPNQLARALAEAAIGPLNYTPTMFRYASFDLDRSKPAMTAQLATNNPEAKEAAEEVIAAIQLDLPHILSLFDRLPGLGRSIKDDDVVVLDEDEARALTWLTAAFIPQSRFVE